MWRSGRILILKSTKLDDLNAKKKDAWERYQQSVADLLEKLSLVSSWIPADIVVATDTVYGRVKEMVNAVNAVKSEEGRIEAEHGYGP